MSAPTKVAAGALLSELAAFAAVLHGANGDGELIAGFQSGPVPAAASQIVGAHPLDAPCIQAALFIGNVDPGPGMRIAPIELRDCPFHRGEVGHVIPAPGVVRERRARNREKARNQTPS